MTFEKTYEIQKNNQLIIKLPERFKSKRKVKVIIKDIVDNNRNGKIEMLKKASQDPLFLDDINEISSDFNPPSRSASADEKVWSNSPGLAPEIRVQGLPWS
jgi:hypothetical protein